MTRSAEELEREVEQTRSRVDHTADAIGDRMSPGQLMDEVMRSLRGSGGSDMLANLGRQVRDNPLPLAMVGAGLAWLMMGSGTRHSEGRYEGSYEGYGAYPGGVPQPGEDYYSMPEGGTGGAGGSSTTGRAKAHASDMASRAAGAARSAADSVAGAASSLGDAVSGAASGAGHAAHGAAHAGGRAGAGMSHAGHYGSRLQRSFLDVIEQEPLVVGALGVAVGAAIGAALPSTRIEDRYLGPARDSALEEGQEMVRERVEDAKDVAAAAYEGAREEADRQGLTSTGTDTLADKAERVAQAGSEAAKEEADKKSGPAG